MAKTIEQTLTPTLRERFESFVKTLDGFESIDALLKGAHLEGMKRADYLIQNRHVVIEQKVLCSNPIEKPLKFATKVSVARGIVNYGRVSTNQIFATQSDSDHLNWAMMSDFVKVIDDDVAKADKQTAQTRQLFNIPDALGILVLLNETAHALRPDVIHWALARTFQKKNDCGETRYPTNDCVILIFGPKSFGEYQFQQTFPMLSFIAPHKRQSAIVSQFSNMMRRQWYSFIE